MIENLFEIVSHKKNSRLESQTGRYSKFQKQFINQNYGYYTEMFLTRTCQHACALSPQIHKISLKKIFREIIKKYFLNDLEIAFVSYFCSKHKWKYSTDHSKQKKGGEQQHDLVFKNMTILIEYVSFFVKSYIGEPDQFNEIKAEVVSRDKNFMKGYEAWVKLHTLSVFTITPREINQIYGQYSKGCQEIETKKDYNDMVDKIMDLSATYSMMTSHKNEKGQESKKVNFDHIPKLRKQPNALSGISEKNQSSSFKYNPFSDRVASKQSIMKCLDSGLIKQNTPKKWPSKTQQVQKEPEAMNNPSSRIFEEEDEFARERSRDKPPKKKISLKSRKKQQPNHPVLDFIKERKQLSEQNENDDEHNERNKDPNKSFYDMNIRENQNMSWMDLRYNRSSRSSGLPLLWKPNQGGFFDKSSYG